MNKLIKKKVNLLLHLAKIDGKFDQSEKQLLLDILKEKGLGETSVQDLQTEPFDLNTVSELDGETELFYWVLRMIKADQYLHPDEVAYSKALALKLKIKPEIVDFYSNREIPNFADFEGDFKKFMISQ